jgi:hypothetical protein
LKGAVLSSNFAFQLLGHRDQKAIRFLTALGRMACCPPKEFRAPAELFRMRHSLRLL